MTRKEADCISATEALLGEGPIWLQEDRAVWFVDIHRQAVCRFDPGNGAIRHWQSPAKVSFVLPIAEGAFLVGLPGKIARFTPDDSRFEPVLSLEGDFPSNRLNDGCIDPFGRLWFGTMDDAEQSASGALYSWTGESHATCQDRGYVISNGPAFSPEGTVMYHTDTLARRIYRFNVSSDGRLSGKTKLIEIEPSAGWPDGTTVDSEGCLWVALWGGWGVRRYSPSGELLEYVRVPCANVTKIAFGGADLRTAYVTTARKALSPQDLEQQPHAGGLFAFAVSSPGQQQHAFAASGSVLGEGPSLSWPTWPC